MHKNISGDNLKKKTLILEHKFIFFKKKKIFFVDFQKSKISKEKFLNKKLMKKKNYLLI